MTRTGRRRRGSGLTLVELLVASVVSAMVIWFVNSFSIVAATWSAFTMDTENATRSLMLASEFIGRDVRRMILHDPTRCIKVSDDGQSVTILTTGKYEDSDFWKAYGEAVTYSLQPLALRPSVKRLMRSDDRGRREIGGCLLTGMDVRLIGIGGLGNRVSLLQVTLFAGIVRGRVQCSSSVFPLRVFVQPEAYTVTAR